MLWDHWGGAGWGTWIHPHPLLLPDLSPLGSGGVLGRFNNGKAQKGVQDPERNNPLEVILLFNGINASIDNKRGSCDLGFVLTLHVHSSALCPCPLQILLAWDGRGQPASAAGISAAELISV